MEQTVYDVIVVGGGIVGLASAYKINLHHPGLQVLVLEKETTTFFIFANTIFHLCRRFPN